MYLQKIRLADFKNYSEFELELHPNVNCLVGDNGVGKTNLLDAIYYLSFCKSYFNSIDSQNIRRGADFFAIHGTYSRDGREVQASCVFRDGQKKMRWDGKTARSLAEHIGKVPLVMVSPNDQQLIVGGSEQRRKFIDGVISQTDHDYLNHLLFFQKAVAQRNRLLRIAAETGGVDHTLLSVWDDQLVEHGLPLYARRRLFMQEFSPLFVEHYRAVSQGAECPELNYLSQLDEGDDYGQRLRNALRADTVAQHTTVGPHKDDIEMRIDGMQVRRYGSQGQQKTVLLALKLAQFDYIMQHFSQKPILLLDDIFDKLDMRRICQLLDLVGGDAFGQVFLTDTQPGRVEQIFAQYGAIEYKLHTLTKR